MEFVDSDGILKRRLNALTDYSRSVDVVHKWLKSDEGTAFFAPARSLWTFLPIAERAVKWLLFVRGRNKRKGRENNALR